MDNAFVVWMAVDVHRASERRRRASAAAAPAAPYRRRTTAKMRGHGADGGHRVVAVPPCAPGDGANAAPSQRQLRSVAAVAPPPPPPTVSPSPDTSSAFDRYAGSVGYVWLYFGAFCASALFIKWARNKQRELNKEPPKNPTIITSADMEADLHVFKCGSCGYEMYPARTREFKFFPETFKCPVCAAGKAEFWDLNDPNDPRNQEDDEDDEDDEQLDTDDDVVGSGGDEQPPSPQLNPPPLPGSA